MPPADSRLENACTFLPGTFSTRQNPAQQRLQSDLRFCGEMNYTGGARGVERHKTVVKGGARGEMKERLTVFSGATIGVAKVTRIEAQSKSKLKCE